MFLQVICGRKVLGARINSPKFILVFVPTKKAEQVTQLKLLADIAVPHPQAAFSAFVHGFSSKWTYLSCTYPGLDDLFQPLEDTIHQKFIPCLTGKEPPNVREVPSLSSFSLWWFGHLKSMCHSHISGLSYSHFSPGCFFH